MNTRLYSNSGLHAGIVQELGKAIASGSLAEGMLLPRESELQERFGASRQTVREAIKILAAKGMVRARKRAGTFVQPRASWNLLDPDVLHWHPPEAVPDSMLRDLFEIRYLIEPASAQLAAQRGDPAKVERIGDAIAAMKAAIDDPDKFYEADIDFHLGIFAASGNELIDRLSTILQPLLEVNFSLRRRLGPGGRARAYEHHAAIYEAIARGDPDRARRAMEALLDRASAELFDPPDTDPAT
jgi:GntR family galactonate operon transcriptional repressor